MPPPLPLSTMVVTFDVFVVHGGAGVVAAWLRDDDDGEFGGGGCCCGCLDDDFGGSSARRDFLADEPLGRGSFFVVADGTTMAKTHQ